VQVSVLEYRKRETAILDRYIAVKVGEELRQVESALSEDSGELDELFHRHQVGIIPFLWARVFNLYPALRENRRSLVYLAFIVDITSNPSAQEPTRHAVPITSLQHLNYPNSFMGSGDITFPTGLGTW
jgi:hypothetical protein